MKKKLIKEVKKIIKNDKLDINLKLSDDLLIEEFINKVDWEEISELNELSEQFIEEFINILIDDCTWNFINSYQKLSEKFIEKYKDEVNWECICMSQTLSEQFIEKFQDEVFWECIGGYQLVSEKFILKHWNKLDKKDTIECRDCLTPDFLWWLYKTDQIELYELLKNKNSDFTEYGNMIEQQFPKILIEF